MLNNAIRAEVSTIYTQMLSNGCTFSVIEKKKKEKTNK